MWQATNLVHILGAIMMGFYGVAPFIANRLKTSSVATQEGILSSMSIANRIGQVMLIVQFLSGGYLMTFGDYSVLWMVLVVVVFLLIGAFSGMMGSALKKSLTAAIGNKKDEVSLDKVKLFSIMTFIAYIVIVVLMVYSNI